MPSLKQKYFRYLLYFFALVSGWPCVFYLMGWLPFYKTNYIILFFLAGAAALSKGAYQYVPKPISIIIVFQITLWLLYWLFFEDSSYFTRVFILLITFSILGLQLRYRDRFEFIKTYNFWLAFQSIAGSIGFILVLSGLLQPISRFFEMDGRLGYYYGLFTTNAVFGGFVRNAGFYDEPGSLATWGMFALLFNKLFTKDKKTEYVLLFGLTSTLSLAYFIQVAAYLVLFYSKRLKNIVPLAIAFLLLLKVLASINDGLDDAIFGRFVINEQTGNLTGDNRSELLERCWRVFTTAPLTGVGATNLVTNVGENEGFVGANFFVNLASDGIIGAVTSYLPLLFLLLLGILRRQYLYAFIIILLGYFQRPYTETQLLYPLVQYTILLFAYLDVTGNRFLDRSKFMKIQ